MPARTNAQQLELKDIFRRASRDPNRQSPFRKDAFRRLLDLSREPDLDTFCKKLVTERVKDFFVDFPEFQDEAINTVYDMCEDQDQEIRIAGYAAITSVSRADKSWLVRNVDVLVQLLQSDDPREVTVIKKALQEHVDLDPRNTLKVLCDQCVFDPVDLADDDDRMLRARLRALVLQFLAEKYRACIARVVRDREVEEILLKGMIGAIAQASPPELRMITTDILLNLPSLLNAGPTQNGNIVLDALLDATRKILLNAQPDIDKLSSLLEEVARVIAPPSPAARSTPTVQPASRTSSMRPSPAADPLRILKFFSNDALMQRVPREASLKIVECARAAYDSALNYGNRNTTRVLMLDAAPALLTVLTRYTSTIWDGALSRLRLTLLHEIQESIVDFKDTYSVPPSLAAALNALITELSSTSSVQGSKADDGGMVQVAQARELSEAKQVMELSRSLLKTIERRSEPGPSDVASSHRERDQNGQPDSTKGQSRRLGTSSLAKQNLASTLPNERAGLSHGAASTKASKVQTNSMDIDDEGAAGGNNDASPQARKKLRGEDGTGVGGAPSLLSRMGPALPALISDTSGKRPPGAHLGPPAAELSTSTDVRGSESRGGLISRVMGASELARTRGSPRITFASRAQNSPASAGVGGGDVSTILSSSVVVEKDELRWKEARRDSVTEPMEINILGASMQHGDEIKIKGAAERRKGDNASSGGLSLLARLGNGGGTAHKRKRGPQS